MEKKWSDEYTKIKELGSGGNGTVYLVRPKDGGKDVALKELRGKKNTIKSERFTYEIDTLTENCNKIDGILPLLKKSKKDYWYTMPFAEPAMNYVKEERDIVKIVQKTIELCSTLEELHKIDIVHRDIKPANIYYYNNRFTIADFGLVENPKNNITKSNRGLGAIFTIAPEMKRNPKEADGKKADVFSLAKTLWMFLMGDEKGFDGVYSYSDPSHSLRYNDMFKNEHTVEIEELLTKATDNNPDNRPTMKEVKDQLRKWIDIHNDIDKSQASDWKFLSTQLFGSSAPDSTSWSNREKIIDILNIVGKSPAYNHMLFSDGGGQDFSYAESAAEEKCIRIIDNIGYCYIVKPKKLYYEGFENNFKWNYFLLEFNGLKSISKDEKAQAQECLVEDTPGHYVSAKYAQYGVYDYDIGNPLPVGYKNVCRITNGKFLIVMKNGPYNGISSTYDGRHGDHTASEFKNYVDILIKCQNTEKLSINERYIVDKFRKNRFKDNSHLERITELIASKSASKSFIKGKFMSWNFSNVIQTPYVKKSGLMKFAFEFDVESDSGVSFKALHNKVTYVLCEDGIIRERELPNEITAFYVFDREKAIELKNQLENKVSEILSENGLEQLEEYEFSFSIKAIKCGKPEHLFTKEEIETAMRSADDRENNILVINEKGEAMVLPNVNYGHLFPVRHEIWNSGNVYVGKYSKLETLEDDYVSSLQGWLLYLETGRNHYTDYVHENKNTEDLIKRIKKYY